MSVKTAGISGKAQPSTFFGWNVNDFVSRPVAFAGLVKAENVGVESRTNESLSGARIVKESDFQRHDAFHAQVDFLNQFALLPVIDIDVSAVVASGHIFHVKAFHETTRVTPLSTDHHIVMGLVPVVISKRCHIFVLSSISLFHLESFSINEQKVSFSILLRPISHARNHDISIAQAMSCMGNGHSLLVHFRRFDDLINSGGQRVSSYINGINPATKQSGNNQPVS